MAVLLGWLSGCHHVLFSLVSIKLPHFSHLPTDWLSCPFSCCKLDSCMQEGGVCKAPVPQPLANTGKHTQHGSGVYCTVRDRADFER